MISKIIGKLTEDILARKKRTNCDFWLSEVGPKLKNPWRRHTEHSFDRTMFFFINY